jgi:hypothetical protein
MCDIPLPPSWNGLVIEPPTGGAFWLWLLVPLVLPPLLSAAARARLQDAIDRSPSRWGQSLGKPPQLRWYVVQSTLLYITFTMFLFVALPTDRLRRELEAQTAVRPECQTALDAMGGAYSTSQLLVAFVGVFLPWAIFVASVVYVTNARRRVRPS